VVAIAADGDRSPVLGSIRVPTRIIHGRADPLVPVAAGHDLKAKIRAAQIDIVEGMGHDLPTPLYPRFVDGIAAAAGRA
jgi:pimeloyl-ACP methyl ester carboxylesterase